MRSQNLGLEKKYNGQNNEMIKGMRYHYFLFVLMFEGHLEIEDFDKPSQDYALLLSKDVFDYVSKDEFDFLKKRELISLHSTHPHSGNKIYSISDKGISCVHSGLSLCPEAVNK